MSDVAVVARRRGPMHRRAWVAGGLLAVVIAVVAVLLVNRSSSVGGALHGVRLSAHVVDASRAQAGVDALAGPGRLSVLEVDDHSRQQAVLGRLTYDPRSNADRGGQYALFVIDNDSHRVAPLAWGVGPRGSDVAQGWDGRFRALAHAHSWLAPLAQNHDVDGTSTEPGTAVIFSPGSPGPVVFAAYLPDDALPVTRPAQQVTIALAYVDPDGHPGWVQRLTV